MTDLTPPPMSEEHRARLLLELNSLTADGPSEMFSLIVDRVSAARDEQWRQRLEALRAEVERLRADAEHIANIAHAGGLCGLPEGEALSLIRKLTCRYWPRGKGMKDRVRAAIDAAREAKG